MTDDKLFSFHVCNESRELFRICHKHPLTDMPDLKGKCIVCEIRRLHHKVEEMEKQLEHAVSELEVLERATACD